MKKQNNPKKTKYYTAYNNRKPTYLRHRDIIDSIPERCWWLKQYLRGVYNTRDEK
tara:strand:- start:3065 stop:3229 length:165 start_codon:yes stop_codon:yes gene_type:complete